MSETYQIHVRENPSLLLEDNPDLNAKMKAAFFDANPAYAGQHSTSFLVAWRGDRLVGIEQIQPQAAQPANESTDAPSGEGQVHAPTGLREKPGVE